MVISEIFMDGDLHATVTAPVSESESVIDPSEAAAYHFKLDACLWRNVEQQIAAEIKTDGNVRNIQRWGPMYNCDSDSLE